MSDEPGLLIKVLGLTLFAALVAVVVLALLGVIDLGGSGIEPEPHRSRPGS